MSKQKTRTVIFKRETKETRIQGRLNLDGTGIGDVRCGIRFLDHMLELMAKHGLLDLKLRATGDLDIDLHHTNEDLGLALGEAFKKGLGNKRGIRRMGSAFVPMDETLARVRTVIDLSGRPHFNFTWPKGKRQPAGTGYQLKDAKHFLESFAVKSEVTLHVDVLKAGEDTHHLLEAVFKALGRSLREAVEIDKRVKGVPSTKGKL